MTTATKPRAVPRSFAIDTTTGRTRVFVTREAMRAWIAEAPEVRHRLAKPTKAQREGYLCDKYDDSTRYGVET